MSRVVRRHMLIPIRNVFGQKNLETLDSLFLDGIIMQWKVSKTADYQTQEKRFVKKRPKELEAVLDNLDTFVNALQGGGKLPIKFGFIHSEPRGILAIDQKGGRGGNLAETRLYIFPDPKSNTIYLLTIGDKRQQSKDIQTAVQYVKEIEKLHEKQENELDDQSDEAPQEI